MKLRQMAVAFLLNEKGEVLFLQKNQESTFLAGLLVPIGGHLEPDELNEPRQACHREIEEETGLKSDSIENLTLRYFVLRMKGNQEIRIQYVYFGNVAQNELLTESVEGSLKWLDIADIPKMNVTSTTVEIVNHYHKTARNTEKVYVGSMKSLNGDPGITWGLLEDWEYYIV